MQEALDAGKVDLGQFPQPFAALAEKQMKVRKIFDAKYGVPFEEELIVLIGKDEFLKKNAPAIRAFLEDLKSATQFYLEKPREARQLLIDHKMVRVNPEVYLGMNDYYRDPSLQVDADALEKMQAFQIKAGFQKKHADVRSLVDLSYLPKSACARIRAMRGGPGFRPHTGERARDKSASTRVCDALCVRASRRMGRPPISEFPRSAVLSA